MSVPFRFREPPSLAPSAPLLAVRRQWRGLLAAWPRWTAIAILLTAGLGVVVGLVTSASSTLQGIDRGAREGRLADGMVVTEIPLTPEQLTSAAALGAVLEPTTHVDLPGDSHGRPTEVRAFSAGQELNRPTLDAGTMPRTPGEAVVEKLHADANGLALGDTLTIGGRTLWISGIGSFPDYPLTSPRVATTSDPEGFALLSVTPATFRAWAEEHPDGITWAYGYELRGASEERLRQHLAGLELAPGLASNPYVAAAMDAARSAGLPLSYPVVTQFLPAGDNPRITGVTSDARTTLAVTLVTTVLVMLLVAYVLAEFSRDRILRDAVVIGTQSALGTSSGALLRHYLVLPLAVTVVGSVLGVVLGRVLAPYLGIITDYYSFPAVPVEPSPAVVAAALGLPVLVVALVNVVVVRRALSRPTQELLRPQAASGRPLPLRLGRLPFVAMFRVRQVLRAPGSHLLIVAGIFLCILLMVFGFGMRSAMSGYVERAESDLTFTDYYTVRFPDLTAVPDGGHPAVAVPMQVVGPDGDLDAPLTVLGLPEGNPYFPADVAGLGPQELVLSRAAAHKYRLGSGDTLALGDGTGFAWAFEVVGVADHSTVAFAFTTPEHARALLPPAVPLVAETLAERNGGGADAGGADAGGAAAGGGVPYYNALFAGHPLDIDPDRVAAHTTRAEMLGGVVKFNALLSRIVTLVSWSSMLIMVVVLYVLIRMVVARQRYAISLVKALGYSDRQVARLYLDNYLWLVLASVAVAIPLSVIVMGEVWRLMIGHLPIGIPFAITGWDVAVMVGLALGAYAVVRVASSRETRSVPVTEVLKFRE